MARTTTREIPATGLLTGLNKKLSELESAVGRQAARFSGVLEIGTAISSARDTDALLRLVIEKLSGLLSAEAATLFLLDREKDELWSKVLRGSSLRELRVPTSSGLVGHVLRSGESVLVADAYEDPRFNRDVDRKSGFKTRSIIAVPLRHVSGRILGVVEVLDRRPDFFTTDDVGLVEAVASQLAAVIDNVQLYQEVVGQNEKLSRAKEELSTAVQELDLLYDLERAVTSAAGEAELLERILAKGTSVVGALAGAVLLRDEDGATLHFRSARADASEPLSKLTLKPGQGIVGHVADTGESVRLDDVASSPHHDRNLARKLGLPIRSVLCVPIRGNDRVLGALELLNKTGGFTEADERLATLLAGQTGRAVLLRQAREEGERKARLASIGQMLSGVLHDLRTPMSVISGYAQLMIDEPDEEERRKAVDIIEKQFEQIHAMTRETLAFARGEQELLLRKIYVQQFLAEVEGFLRKDFAGNAVELKVVPNFTGTIRADENKLKRLVYNIARNAAQAMPEGGKFTLTVDRDDGQLLLRMQDNGPGIPPEIADRLFESFVTAGKRGGTGLGLAIVKKIALEHGGEVSCKSKPGKGTTFEVRLPVIA